MRCEARTLDDIRALGGNDAADERRFATAARVSETNLALYRTFAQPVVRAMVNPQMAEWMQRMHPLRLQYEMFSGRQSVHGAGRGGGRPGARRSKACQRRQSVSGVSGDDVRADRHHARCVARCQRKLLRNGLSCRSTARRRCSAPSASIRNRPNGRGARAKIRCTSSSCSSGSPS